MRQKKLPIWVKHKNKFELIPFNEMLTFEDGTKGYLWSKEPPDFVKRNPQYFRVTVSRPYAAERWKFIFTEKPRWVWRRKAKKLAWSLLIVGAFMSGFGLLAMPFRGTDIGGIISLMGSVTMILSCIFQIASLGPIGRSLETYLEDQLDGE